MQFVIILEGDPPIELLSRLSQVLSSVDKAAVVQPVPESKTITLEPGDALIRVEVPSSEGQHFLSVKVGSE